MTIAAIVTPQGESAVSIIRISGDDSWAIAEKLTGKSFEANKMKLAWIKDSADKIDQALVLPFKAPKSFTGEDVIEFHCHGGVWITNKVLDLVLSNGARLAKPGEFTERAFLNQKFDLSQAEAIMDIVSAKTKLSGENAINLYQGQLGEAIQATRESLVKLLGEVIAGIDFPDEVGEFDKERFQLTAKECLEKIESLLESEKEGHVLRHGYKVALIGDPNVGKSSLLNTLLKNERAIVTEVAGTTRDTIEESYSLRGIPLVLIDTAGIRESSDKVEQIGIERTRKAIEDSDMLLFLYDLDSANGDLKSATKETLTQRLAGDLNIEHKNKLLVGTKLDLSKEDTNGLFDVKISSLKNENIDELEDLIHQRIISINSESVIKINERQADLLRQAKLSLEKCLVAVSDDLPQDFWTIDLKASIEALGEITGAVVTEELLDDIFKSFCIGK